MEKTLVKYLLTSKTISNTSNLAETTLKLEALVGELEDATFAIVSRSRNDILFSHSNASIVSVSPFEHLYCPVFLSLD